MTIKQPSDAAVRLQAIDPRYSFLVQAPAGSGKTELLTDRILALLATVNRPEEIIAITFTRKAASEMHARVLSKLVLAQGPRPEDDYQRRSWELARRALQRNDELDWNLLQHPARLNIRTIDAFCSYLVRAMPWLSASGGVPNVTEQAQTHYEAAALATFDMIDDHPAVARLIEHLDVNIHEASRLLATMLAGRDQWLPLLAHGSDLEQLIENLDQSIQDDLTQLEQIMPPGWAYSLADPLRRAADTLATDGNVSFQEALGNWDGQAFGTTPDTIPQWQALAQMLLTQGGTVRQRVNKNQGFPPKSDHKAAFEQWLKSVDPDAPWIQALGNVRHIPASGYTSDQQEIIKVLIQVLWVAAAQLQLRFIETAEVDFIEIAQRALQALGESDDPTDLLLTLDNVVRHVLVDEFQDTSQSQIDLLTRLTAGWMSGDGRTLFLVGDPMQSIYRFRKAEVGWFLHVKEHGLGNIRLQPLELTTNFRSQAHLVHSVNRLCAPIFPQSDDLGLGAIQYTASVPFNEPVDACDVEFHPVWAPKGAGVDQAAAISATSDAIAVSLAREALDRYPDSPHPVAILVRARSHLNNVVLRLSQSGVPCRAVDLVTLRSRQVVIDLVQLARALSHPADRLAWLCVLRSPLCGLSLTELHTLTGDDLRSSVPALLKRWMNIPSAKRHDFSTGQARRLEHVTHILLDTGNASGTMPFCTWLESCWNRLGGPSIYHSDSDRADAESLFRLIEELAPYGNLNPAELEAGLDKLYAAPESSGRAVEVMTIHKAKGLEFESVILLGLGSRGQPDRAPLIRFEQSEGRLLLGPVKRSIDDSADPVSQYLSEREKQRARFETDRLLYVALTRARSELHLIAAVTVDESGVVSRPVPTSLLARMWDQLVVPPPPDWSELDHDNVATAEAVSQRYLVRPALDAPVPARPSVVGMGRPLAIDRSAWEWRQSAQTERALGSVAHAWLERIGRDGIEQWPLARLENSQRVFRRQLSRAGIIAQYLDDAADVLNETLVSTLGSEKGRWLLQISKAYREWSLLDFSGRVSIIDLAISQDQNWLVVDYKTGVPDSDESLSDYAQRMRHTYQDQLERYCEHVSALDGRPARAALFFPRVDLWVDC